MCNLTQTLKIAIPWKEIAAADMTIRALRMARHYQQKRQQRCWKSVGMDSAGVVFDSIAKLGILALKRRLRRPIPALASFGKLAPYEGSIPFTRSMDDIALPLSNLLLD
jgi:hypothetical protein